jgi:hypothetical protein
MHARGGALKPLTIELNPVRAGMAAHPRAYSWSSYRAHALGAADALVRFIRFAARSEGRRSSGRKAFFAVPRIRPIDIY